MSRRMLLAGDVIPTAVPADPPPAATPQTTYPSTSDPLILAARPTGRSLATYTVSPAFPASETNFHTVGAALTAAQSLQNAAIKQTSISVENSTLGSPYGPDYRVDIIVAAGTYAEELGAGSWVNLIGATGNPDDVVIQTNATGGGTFHPYGPLYLEGIRFNALPNGGAAGTGPKYPMHITAGGPGAVIAARCKFISTNPGGAGSVGLDGGERLFVYFYDCDMSAPGGLMNLHGAASNTAPVTVVYEKCRNNGDFTYDEITTLAGVTDDAWAVQCTNTATAGPADLVTSGSVTEHLTGSPPRPSGALGSAGIAYYYPSAISGPFPVAQVFGSADQAAFSPPVGRTYYIRVTPTSALHRTHIGVVAAAPGGTVGVRSGRRSTPPATGAPGLSALPTLVSGANDGAFYYFDTYYPGETAVYALVGITSGTPSLMGSLELASTAYYSDDGGATVLPVPGGQRVPVVRLRSDS